MRLTAREVAVITGGTLNGSPDIVLTGAAGLDEAGPADVSFLSNLKYLAKLSDCKAGLILVPESAGVIDRPLVTVKNPQLSFSKVLEVIDRERFEASRPVGIHPTAVISPGAKLGAGCTVGACTFIGEDAVLGERVTVHGNCSIGRETSVGDDSVIYPNVTLRERCAVGRRAVIQPGVVIGSDGFGFVPTGTGNRKIPQIGNVVIGDDVEIGANCAIDRATTGSTRIGDGTKIDNLVHIAHNVRIGRNCLIAGQVGIAGSAVIGNSVTFAGQSGAVGHITIGDNVVVAGRAGVTADTPSREVVSGFPAIPHREDLRNLATLRRLPKIIDELKRFMKNDPKREKE